MIYLLPWRCSEGRDVTAKMEDFRTFITTEQLPSILADSTPVFIGVFIYFWGLLCLLLTLL